MATYEGKNVLLEANDLNAFDMQQFARRIVHAVNQNTDLQFTDTDGNPQLDTTFFEQVQYRAIRTDGPGHVVIAATAQEWSKLTSMEVESETTQGYDASSYTTVILRSNEDNHERRVIIKSSGVMHDILIPDKARSLKTDTLPSLQNTQEAIGLINHNTFQPDTLTVICLGFRVQDTSSGKVHGTIDIVKSDEPLITL